MRLPNPLKDRRPAGHLVGAVTEAGREFAETAGITKSTP
jgi:hypothetical protein